MNEAVSSKDSTATQQKKAQAVDRYGWYEVNRNKNELEIKAEKEDSDKEAEREDKWLSMMANWTLYTTKKRDTLAERVRKGIPDSIRVRAWTYLTDCYESLQANEPSMSDLLLRPPTNAYETIDKDVKRSLPQVNFFDHPEFVEKLRRVLYAYAQTDTELGYTQGMNFVAGIFLIYLDEETAFRAFKNAMSGKRTLQREFLTLGFPRLEIANKMFRSLMRKKYPQILANIEAQGVDFPMFTAGWFLPAFQSFTWPPEFQLRIFERFLFYGLRSLLSFGLVIISRHKSQLSKGSLEVLLPILQKPDETEEMRDWRYCMKKWDELWIKKGDYLKLLSEAGAPPESLF